MYIARENEIVNTAASSSDSKLDSNPATPPPAGSRNPPPSGSRGRPGSNPDSASSGLGSGNSASSSVVTRGGVDKKSVLRLTTYASQVRTLTSKNWMSFVKDMVDVQYYAMWPDHVLDIAQKIAEAWDGVEEKDDFERQSRRDAYALICMKMAPELKHLRVGVDPGDARGQWKRLHNRFNVYTPFAIDALEVDIRRYTMESSGTRFKTNIFPYWQLKRKNLTTTPAVTRLTFLQMAF